METDILKSFSNLQFELEEAKHSLKSVDDNIKKIIGRDPSELPSRLNKKRLLDEKGRAGLKTVNRIRKITHEVETPISKRRNIDPIFKRLSTAIQEDIHQNLQKQMISKVIVTSREVPSREDALEAQNKDEKFRARNRRMFGALLGTLQKFQQEETKLKPREEKRAQLEKKIEEHEIKEREEIKKERHELFLNRKKKQIEIKTIELKMSKLKEYTTWVQFQKPRENFILTKSDPHINYLPRRLNSTTKDLLVASKQNIQEIIEKRNMQILEELKQIEDKMKRNFHNKYAFKNVKQNQEIVSSEFCNQDKHYEVSNELAFDENDSGKEDVNAVNEISAEFYSVGKHYGNSNQDKENKHLLTIKNSETVLSESDEPMKCNDASICEVI